MKELQSEKKKSSRLIKIVILSIALTFAVLAAIKFFHLDKLIFRGPQTVVRLITDTGLKNEKRRTNVLLLGIGGRGHEGPNLSDTMILASIEREGKDVVLVSIPRDMWAETISAKVNSAYAYGQDKDRQGLQLASETVGDLLGVPVHYAVRVDFGGFTRAVDLMQGLDVDVENAFTDPKYPIAGKEDDLCGLTLEKQDIDGQSMEVVKDATGAATPLDKITDQNNPFVCRYESITFKQGQQHMGGTTALKFVRSRYGTNGEGSDFARSARQQKTILAFRQKVLSSETLTDPKKIIDLITTFGDSIDTNITNDEVPLFAKLGTKIDPETTRRIVLDASREESLLEVGDPASHGGQFVLIAKGNNWQALRNYLYNEIFKGQENKSN